MAADFRRVICKENDARCKEDPVGQTHEHQKSFIFHEENTKSKEQKTNDTQTIKSVCVGFNTPVIDHREDFFDSLIYFHLRIRILTQSSVIEKSISHE